MKNQKITFLMILCTFVCLGFLIPKAFGMNPPPDGCYPNFTTAEGCNALQTLTTGAANTALGWYSLFGNSTGMYNTGVGTGALALNNGNSNTAVGVGALLLNTAGGQNMAVGALALENNTTGNANTASGSGALFSNTSGDSNTASGESALFSNTTGGHNTACGYAALANNSTGSANTALGNGAGFNATTGNGNVYVGTTALGVAGESNTTYISNIYAAVASARAMYVNSDNKIGTLSSSRRYKEEIKPMNHASDVILELKPVSYRYKKEIDRSHALCFGLIAEEVAQISPELITRDNEGKPQTVRYEAVNAMLLNEFLKEHRKVQSLETKLAQQEEKFESKLGQQQKQIESLVADLQRIITQMEISKAAPRIAAKAP